MGLIKIYHQVIVIVSMMVQYRSSLRVLYNYNIKHFHIKNI